jgi:hypothetical protein
VEILGRLEALREQARSHGVVGRGRVALPVDEGSVRLVSEDGVPDGVHREWVEDATENHHHGRGA